MRLEEQIMKLQTYKMFEGEDTVYVERDDVLKLLEQEPCEDAISREDALMALTGEWTELTDEMIHHFIKRIKKLQPVTPQLKTGHWEWVQYDSNPNIGNWHCSECGRIVFLLRSQKSDGSPLYDYCPWCGAKMQEVTTDADSN